VSAGPTPTVRRRRLGSELRRLREAHGLKLDEAAHRLGLAPSTLSRIETGKAPTRLAYLTTMLDMYGVTDPGQRQVLADMAREGYRKGWWAEYEDVLPTGFGSYVGFEAEAALLRAFEDRVVHGLVQTPDYARAVVTAVHPAMSADEAGRVVQLRVHRQEILTSGSPLELWLILDESVIRRPVGGPSVMSAQLEHLLAVGERPNVTLQLLPLAAGAHPALNGAFSILRFPEPSDPDMVYAEGVTGSAYLEKELDVHTCSEAFERLRQVALSPAGTADAIGKAAEEITIQGGD
jgi:transcriptional regulator with XRE-family HTH domain